MKRGTLYGVGVGPGDPELLTMKAVRILREAQVVAFFSKKKSDDCVNPNGNAFAAAEPHLAAGRQEIAMVYPVTTEHPVGDPRYDDAMTRFYEAQAARIAERLNAGEDVAVLAEGDPFFYGSFMHLFRRLADRYPHRSGAGCHRHVRLLDGEPSADFVWRRRADHHPRDLYPRRRSAPAFRQRMLRCS